jgi:hypothetical protein
MMRWSWLFSAAVIGNWAMPAMATVTAVPSMHEEMHDDAAQQQNGGKCVARKDMDAVFIAQQQRTDSQKNQQGDSGARLPEPFDGCRFAMVMVGHFMSSLKEITRQQQARLSKRQPWRTLRAHPPINAASLPAKAAKIGLISGICVMRSHAPLRLAENSGANH